MSKPRDPVELFQAVTAALSAENWDAVAALCDPVGLRRFQHQLLVQYRRPAHVAEMNADWVLKHNPEMPREVAEYTARAHQRFFEPDRLRSELPAFESLAMLETVTPARAFALWLDSHSPSRQIERLGGTRKLPPEAVALIQRGFGGFERVRLLGAVYDGDTIAHILMHQSIGDIVPPEVSDPDFASLPEDEKQYARERSGTHFPQVSSCRRQADGTWLMLVDNGFFRVGSTTAAFAPIELLDDAEGSDTPHSPSA